MKLLSTYRQFELVKVRLEPEDPLKHLERIVYHMDEPFVYDSPLVRFKIAEAIHQHGFKVSLTGEGADELLGGYTTYSHLFLLELWRERRLTRLGSELAFTLLQPDWRLTLSRFASRLMKSEDARLRSHFVEHAERSGCLLSASDRGAAIQERDLSVKEKLHSQLTTFFLPYLLACNDKMYMAHAVESRAPFLDVEIAELLLSIQTKKLIVRGLRKYPLREAMRGRVPDTVLFDKRKIGFASPLYAQLAARSAKEWVRGLFKDARSAKFVDPKRVIANFDAVPTDGRVGDFLAHALTLELWMRQFDIVAG